MNRWQEASEFLCYETPLFGESWATKNIAKKPQKCFLQRATNIVFSKFRDWRRRKKNCAPRGFVKPRGFDSLIH